MRDNFDKTYDSISNNTVDSNVARINPTLVWKDKAGGITNSFNCIRVCSFLCTYKVIYSNYFLVIEISPKRAIIIRKMQCNFMKNLLPKKLHQMKRKILPC